MKQSPTQNLVFLHLAAVSMAVIAHTTCQANFDGDGAPCAFDDTNLASSSVAQSALSGDKNYENKAVFYEGCTNHLHWIVGRLGLTIGIFGITNGFAIITMSLIAIMQ
jgi:hypothetical protein